MADTLPIAETFHSIQGEGEHVGRPMHFVRLAGCTVGEPQPSTSNDFFPILSTGRTAYRCHTWDGRPFWCDTDFRKAYDRRVDELVAETFEDRVCLTGGEPLAHQKRLIELGFFQQMFAAHKRIHIETSGTILLDRRLMFDVGSTSGIWLTVSPKQGVLDEMLDMASEIRFLVDEHFDPDKIPEKLTRHTNVFLCPINSEHLVDLTNVELTLNWLKKFPRWRMSCQMHKFLGLR